MCSMESISTSVPDVGSGVSPRCLPPPWLCYSVAVHLQPQVTSSLERQVPGGDLSGRNRGKALHVIPEVEGTLPIECLVHQSEEGGT